MTWSVELHRNRLYALGLTWLGESPCTFCWYLLYTACASSVYTAGTCVTVNWCAATTEAGVADGSALIGASSIAFSSTEWLEWAEDLRRGRAIGVEVELAGAAAVIEAGKLI